MTQEEFSDYKNFAQFILKSQLDEYKILLIDMDNLQSGVIKHYLWLNVLMIGGIVSFINLHFHGISELSTLSTIYYSFYVFSVIMSALSFLKLIVLLKGFYLEAPAEFYAAKLYDSYGSNEKSSVIKTEDQWIHEMDTKINNARKQYSSVGCSIQEVNTSTVWSTGAILIGTIFLFLERLLI